jgi:hypothetical protein
LYEARRIRKPVPSFTDDDPSLGMADSYAIQQELVAMLLGDGDRIVGYKVVLTSAPMQRDVRHRLARLRSGAGLHGVRRWRQDPLDRFIAARRFAPAVMADAYLQLYERLCAQAPFQPVSVVGVDVVEISGSGWFAVSSAVPVRVDACAVREASAAARVPPAAEAPTTVQAMGPIGVHPKNWLTTGVSMIVMRTAADPMTVAMTSGLCRPVSRVWPSWVPTTAARPILLARADRPV